MPTEGAEGVEADRGDECCGGGWAEEEEAVVVVEEIGLGGGEWRRGSVGTGTDDGFEWRAPTALLIGQSDVGVDRRSSAVEALTEVQECAAVGDGGGAGLEADDAVDDAGCYGVVRVGGQGHGPFTVGDGSACVGGGRVRVTIGLQRVPLQPLVPTLSAAPEQQISGKKTKLMQQTGGVGGAREAERNAQRSSEPGRELPVLRRRERDVGKGGGDKCSAERPNQLNNDANGAVGRGRRDATHNSRSERQTTQQHNN